jgi:hypothetical protein
MRSVKWLGFIVGSLLAFNATTAAAQELVVRVRPPRAIVETRGRPPGPRHIWLSGYHRWDGHRYEWVRGRWELPPRRHAHWVRYRWVHRRHGWVLVGGHWR